MDKESTNIKFKVLLTEEEFINSIFYLQETATIPEDRVINKETTFYKGLINRLKMKNINNKIFQITYYNGNSNNMIESENKINKQKIVNMKSLDDFNNMKYIFNHEYKHITFKKQSLLFLILKNTIMVHLDKIKGFGFFLVINFSNSKYTDTNMKIITNNLLKSLNLKDKKLLKGSYSSFYIKIQNSDKKTTNPYFLYQYRKEESSDDDEYYNKNFDKYFEKHFTHLYRY